MTGVPRLPITQAAASAPLPGSAWTGKVECVTHVRGQLPEMLRQLHSLGLFGGQEGACGGEGSETPKRQGLAT